MTETRSHFDRLLRKLHRRAMFWRVAECTGAGVAIGATLAGVVSIVALFSGIRIDAYAIGICMVAWGGLLGLIRGVTTRPTPQRVAMEADRQLKLSDLLSTALACRETNEPWGNVVIAQADRKAKEIGANDIILQRLGVRAWGGIGVTTAIAIVLVVMAAEPDRVTAGKPVATNSAISEIATTTTELQSATAAASAVKQSVKPGVSQDASQWPSVPETNDGTESGPRQAGATPGDGSGGASSAQNQNEPIAPVANRNRNSNVARSDDAERTGAAQAGDGRASTDPTSGTDALSGGIVQGRGNDLNATSSNDINVAPAGAGSNVNIQNVPDAYRDVVRAYFDR